MRFYVSPLWPLSKCGNARQMSLSLKHELVIMGTCIKILVSNRKLTNPQDLHILSHSSQNSHLKS